MLGCDPFSTHTVCNLDCDGGAGGESSETTYSSYGGTGTYSSTTYSGGYTATSSGPTPQCSDDFDCEFNQGTDSCHLGKCDQGSCILVDSKEPSCTHCYEDSDCAAFTPADPCQKASCDTLFNQCEVVSNVGSEACKCDDASECPAADCASYACTNHQCIPTYFAAGPAPKQYAGDCSTALCDGVTDHSTPQYDGNDVVQKPGNCRKEICDGSGPWYQNDASDVPPPKDECSTPSCDSSGDVVYIPKNGGACQGGSGYCFQGDCLTGCAPQNASSCGGEGVDEPTNNDPSVPEAYSGNSECGFLNKTDVDWYHFYAVDDPWAYDVLEFYAWSTAPTVTLCAYVKCADGSAPQDGCAVLSPGPNGSQGCCWTGASANYHESWDLNCSSGDDAGDVYVKVNSPTADACDQYAVQMYY